MRLILPMSVSLVGVVTLLGPVGGVISGVAWGVQLREVSLSQLAALLSNPEFYIDNN